MAESHRPFRRAVLRGLAIVTPPLLTVVLFLWAWSTIEHYVLVPLESVGEWVLVASSREVLTEVPFPDPENDKRVSLDEQGNMVSFHYREKLFQRKLGPSGQPRWVGYYTSEWIRENRLQRAKTLPFFIAAFVLVLYLLGKFVAAGVGRMLVTTTEGLIQRLPLVSNVYSSVKQVTDFVFSERELEFNRVVAIEYPRKGIWSIGFVTGDSLLDIRSAANEPVLTVLIPTSPMPVTGFSITVLKSETVDLNLTVDQAIQFIVSCGVVVPPHQQVPLDRGRLQLSTPAVSPHGEDNGRDAAAEPAVEQIPASETSVEDEARPEDDEHDRKESRESGQ